MRSSTRPTLDLTLPATSAQPASLLPDIRNAIRWRTWDEGCQEAARRRRPMLVVAEPHWANSAQRVALLLQGDAALANSIQERVVPVLVDPAERPDLAARWQRAAIALTGTAGPPLIIVLTHEAHPFLAYCTMNLEGDDTYPSLGALIESVADAYTANLDDLATEAQRLSATGPDAAEPAASDWDALRAIVDSKTGGLEESPKHPRPALLWTALDAHAGGELPDDLVQWLQTTLNAMIRGGIYDQLDRGFHRSSRDARWIVPHFEKPIPLNAQLAAVYARAADLFSNDQFRRIAGQVASLCTAALRDGIDVVASDTGYYTWTSREVRTQLEPELLQVISLHFDIQPVDERQALHRVIEMDQMDRYSHEDINLLHTRLQRGRTQLLALRQRRPAPAAIALPNLAARAVTLRWLVIAGEWLDSMPPEPIHEALATLIDGRFDSEHGYVRPADGKAWLEDQAALLAALVTASQATQEPRWRHLARELGDVLIDKFWTDQGWKVRADADTICHGIHDDILPSTLDTLAQAFDQLASLTNDPATQEQAIKSARTHRLLALGCGHWSAALPGHTR